MGKANFTRHVCCIVTVASYYIWFVHHIKSNSEPDQQAATFNLWQAMETKSTAFLFLHCGLLLHMAVQHAVELFNEDKEQ